jgi:hypothetical protein
MMLLYVFINNSLFISMCILKDLIKEKNPRLLCQGNSPNFICLHDPIEIFLSYKNKKEVTK